jgi:hypothetical protein
MGGGSGNAADGFSFNFADDLGGGTIGEEGAGTGLIVAFDIYDNGGGEAPAIDLKVGGVVVQSKKLAKDTTDAGILTGNDFCRCPIEYRDGLLDVDFKGQSIYNDRPSDPAPISAGRFGFGARTGGENNNHWIDDLRIETFARPLRPSPAPAAPPRGSRAVTGRAGRRGQFLERAGDARRRGGAGTATKSGSLTYFTHAGANLPGGGFLARRRPDLHLRHGRDTRHPELLGDHTALCGDSGVDGSSVRFDRHDQALPAWRVHQVASETTSPTRNLAPKTNWAGLLGNNIADPNAVGAADAAAAAPARRPPRSSSRSPVSST